MERRLAVFLLCAPIAFGQRPRVAEPRPGSPPPGRAVLLDAVVSDAGGHPVSGLSVDDFEVTQNGEPQKISNLTWFDSKSHTTSAAISEAAPKLAPEDICRNLVLIVDDFGLAPERALALQILLRGFVSQQLAPGDRAAIVRTSSGVGRHQQLTTDRSALSGQIDHIQPVGRGMTAAAIASAIWQSIRWTADGLRTLPGRKSVVLISEHLDARVGPADNVDLAQVGIASAANAATMVFYTLDPRGPAEPPAKSILASLVTVTGGLAAPDLASVLRDQEGYYVIGFHPTQESKASTPPVLHLRGKVLNLRWRFGFLSRPTPLLAMAPPDRQTAALQAMSGAVAPADIRTHVTPLFSSFIPNGAHVEVLVHIDARDLSVMRDLKGMYHMSAEVQVSAFGDSGRLLGPPSQAYTMTATDVNYEKARRDGLVYTTRLTLPGPGGYQVRAAVADNLADRFGTAMEFVEIPEVNKGKFALSGLVVRPESAAEQPLDDTAANRIFSPGAALAFTYAVYNASQGAAKESRLKVTTRIYATARQVYEGRPIDLDFPASSGGAAGRVKGRVQLDSRLSPGLYVIEVEVADMLAKDGTPRVATQYTTFEVRE